MGFQIQICSMLRTLRFSWSILVMFCVPLPTSSSKTQMLLLKKNIYIYIYPTNIYCFVIDSISAYHQIPDRFYITSMEFLSLSRRHSSSRNVPSGEVRGETAVFAGELKGNSKTHFRYVNESLGAQNNDLGAASQALLRRVKFCLQGRLYQTPMWFLFVIYVKRHFIGRF